MKRMLLALCVGFSMAAIFADDAEISVRVSVPGEMVSFELKRECRLKGRKVAVQKYLLERNPGMPERITDEAMSSYAKFTGSAPEVVTETFEDGQLTGEYVVEVEDEELSKWLQGRGFSANIAANGTQTEVVILEEPPDMGAIKVAAAFGTDLGKNCFFFQRYTMFQRRVRDALVKKTGKFGFDVLLLEDNDAYAEYKKDDPVLVGVSFDPNAGEQGSFKITDNFLKSVRDNNPETIALYYRIDTLSYGVENHRCRAVVALSLKNLATGTTRAIGTRDFEIATSNSQPDMLMADFGNCVAEAMNSLLNGEGMGKELQHLVASVRNAESGQGGPLKTVINFSKVDSKIRTRARLAVKKACIAKGICRQDGVKIVGNALSFTVVDPKLADKDELWVALVEIFEGAGIEATDDQMTSAGNTLTVNLGK